MADAIEVETTTIDTELSTMSRAEQWLAATAEAVTGECAKYDVPESIGDDTELKAATDSRTAVRKAHKKYDDERKAMLRDVEDRIRQFKSEVKDVLSPLSDLDAEYKAVIDAYNDAWREQRRADLAQEYAKLAPDLVEHVDTDTGEIVEALVPFERVLERYGNETGMVWLNKTKWVLVLMSLKNAVHDIEENEKALDSLISDPEDLESVKALYFLTLDYDRAMREADRLREQRERVRALEFERKQRELEAKKMPVTEPEPNPGPAPEPTTANVDVPHPWVLVVGLATKAQMLMVRDFMHSQGIEGGTIYSGTIDDAFRKEHFNG